MTDKSLPNNPQDDNEPAKDGKTYAPTDKSFEAVKWRFAAGLAKRKAAATAAAAAQQNMFDMDSQDPPATPEAEPAGNKNLLPVRHTNREFFLADIVDCAFKDDSASMEAPIFSLSTKPDLTTWYWESRDGKKRMEVTPSVLGRATMHDKDVLIYVTSQMTEALNRERPDALNRVVRFTVHDYLVTTNKNTGGAEYDTFQTALRRLTGTRIYTNVETGGERTKKDFGILDNWEIVEKSNEDEKMIAVEVTLSEWLFKAIQHHEVLTLHSNYFRLRKPTDRRIYELARKHCGHQAIWIIGLTLLHEKSGSRGTIYEFHEAMKTLADSNHLPDYCVSVSAASALADVQVTFYTRDAKRLARALAKKNAPNKYAPRW